MRKIILMILILFTGLSYAQVGINTNTPDASSALEIESTTGGILIPRMTETQRDAIVAPAAGLMIYQTDESSGFYFCNGTAWTKIDGVAGPQGDLGPAGPQGLAGADGEDGAQGPPGPTGNIGSAGAQGVQGEIGPQGLVGADGADGAQGPPGPTGNIGSAGAQGVQGEIGPQGLAGADGADGAQGPPGPTGNTGSAGAQGVQGETGPQGGVTEATYGLTLTGSGTQNDPYLISLPTGGAEGQVLKIENGVPLWADLCSNIYYRDLDGDSYGNNLDSITFCDLPVGYVIDNTDCDDLDASVHPGAAEIDDDIDNNCDGVIDEGFNEPSNCDDISYPSIVYGTQQWTVENACHTTYRDGTLIPHVTDTSEWADLTTGAWTYYDNNLEKGKLYNWYAVMGIHDTDPNTLNKEFAPESWHVPTNAEWTTLENHLIANGFNYDDTTIGNKINKAIASTTGWNISTVEGGPGNEQSGNNSSGFNAFPVGSASGYSGEFSSEGYQALFWTSTVVANASYLVHNRTLSGGSSEMWTNGNYKPSGFSVRLVKD
jgi:uncharacterized protein (TIGR02145 family)